MTIRLTLIILFSALILVGCKKELEPLQDNIETPIFFVSGDIDTVPFSFTAGEKGYYMETQFIQQRDTFGNPLPLSLRSYLTKKNCLNCQKSFSIYVMSTNYDTSFSFFNIDSIFYVGREIKITSDSTFNINLFTPNNVLVSLNNSSTSFDRYYSSRVVQTSGKMKITKVEPFDNNDYGMKTVKVSFDIVCFVADATYTPIRKITASGTFAFAYPSP